MDVRRGLVLLVLLVSAVGCGRLGFDRAPLSLPDAGVSADADVAADGGDVGVDAEPSVTDAGPPFDPTLQRTLAELTYATAPPALRCPVLASDPSTGRVILYGGLRDDMPYDGMWELGPSGWRAVCEGDCAPGPRGGHAFVFDAANGVFVLFGGSMGGSQGTNDVWEWDGATWSERTPSLRPSPRRDAQFAFDPSRGVLVVFGGRAEIGAAAPFDEIWEYQDGEWRIPRAAGERPTPRMGCGGGTYADARALHPAARDRVVFYGGTRDSVYTSTDDVLDDAWAWDGTRFEQVCEACTGDARSSAALGYDARTGRILIVGGYLGASQELSGIWELDDAAGATLRDPAPTRRDSLGLAYEAVLDRFVLFGGNGDGCPGDCGQTWAYVL